MKKVLIVEDEVIIAIDLKSKLERLGYKFLDIVYNSDNLTDKICSLKPDLILLDINIMGSRNGIQMAHIINREFKIPFIYVTSYTDQQTLSEVKETNPIGYVVKPFTIEDIQVELELALFRHKNYNTKSFPDFESLCKNSKLYLAFEMD
jgi:AmiR/NasT family two-component response regulator